MRRTRIEDMLSAYHPIATAKRTFLIGRFVPIAAASRCSKKQPYSITSSARRSSAVGTVRPNILAVFRLIMSSTPVG